ncbi:MAG: PKD domain-containing protein [Candidatus Methylophosphatis roskildensis]
MYRFFSSVKAVAAYLVVLLLALFAHPALAGQAGLAWNASASSTVTGYKIHYGATSAAYSTHVDVGNSLSATVPNLTAGAKYFFAVTAYNASGESGYSNEASATIPVAVSAPVALFDATATLGTAPLATTFTSKSTGSITSYAWDFGDSTTATGASVNKTYSTPGRYKVTLTVSGAGGSNSTSKTVTASAPTPAPTSPTADFSAPTTTGAAPLTVNFTATASSGLASFVWDFGDGSTGSGSGVSHTYLASGNYNVTLTASGTAGSAAKTKPDYVQVSNQLAAGFSANKVYGTAPMRVGFKDESNGTVNSYFWTFGDGATSTEANPFHTYRKSGTYSVSLKVTGPAGSKTQTQSSYVKAIAANDLVVDFGLGNGIWAYINSNVHDGLWTKMDGRTARNIVIADVNHDGFDETVVDLGNNSYGVSQGIWTVSQAGRWTRLDSRTASKIVVGDVDGNGQDDLLFDFGTGQGLWMLSNGSAWRQIDTRSANNLVMVDLDGDGKDEIVADFGRGSGIWAYGEANRWVQVDTRTATWMLAADLDGNNHMDLVIDFGAGNYRRGRSNGVWVLFNGTTWFQIDPDSAAIGKAFSSDDGQRDQLALYFAGTNDLWIYANSILAGTSHKDNVGSDWSKVSAGSVTRLGAADLNADNRKDLIIDYGTGTSGGLWKYQKGVLKQINTKTTTGIASGQFNYGL